MKTWHVSFQMKSKKKFPGWKWRRLFYEQRNSSESWGKDVVAVAVSDPPRLSGLPVGHAWLSSMTHPSLSESLAPQSSSGYLRGLPRTLSPYQSKEGSHFSDIQAEREQSCWETVFLLFTLDSSWLCEEVLFPLIHFFSFCHLNKIKDVTHEKEGDVILPAHQTFNQWPSSSA